MRNVLLGAIFGLTIGMTLMATAAQDEPGGAAVAPVCWDNGKTCVPLSVVKATFDGYVKDGPAPTLALRQDLINIQTQLADELRKERECEGVLGPLQAAQHADLLKAAQTALDKANVDATPPGMVWDGKKYVTKTPGAGRGGV